MRMWNVDVSKMCRKHLLGEHVEIHMFVGTLNKGISVKGYIDKKLLEVHNLQKRHDEIVKEMIKRGYNHKSLLPEYEHRVEGCINVNDNEVDLHNRCKECKF